MPFSGMQVRFPYHLCSEFVQCLPNGASRSCHVCLVVFLILTQSRVTWEKKGSSVEDLTPLCWSNMGQAPLWGISLTKDFCGLHSSSCAVPPLGRRPGFHEKACQYAAFPCGFASGPISRPWISALASLNHKHLPPTGCFWSAFDIATET